MTATNIDHQVVSRNECCRPARRISRAAASILPGFALVLLPKCPLCLAAWLTLGTGIGFSAASAVWMRGLLWIFSVAAVLFAAAPIVRRRAFLPLRHKIREFVSRHPHRPRPYGTCIG